MSLTPNTILVISQNQKSNPLFLKPRLQIYNIERLVKTTSSEERYKALLSDGQYYINAVFTSELSRHFSTGMIKDNYYLKITSFELRTRPNILFMYVNEIEGFEKGSEKEGSPRNINDKKSQAGKSEEFITKENGHNTLNQINNSNNVNIGKSNSLNNDNYAQVSAKRKSVGDDSNAMKKNSCYSPIASINPFTNKWTIKGRCTTKSDIRTFTSQKGEGKLFSLNMADESGSIKITAFNDVVDYFYEMFDVGKVYSISNGSVKMGNRKYSTASSEYEINLEKNSEVVVVYDSQAPKYFFNFVKCGDLKPECVVDFIGAVKSAGEVQSIILKKDGSTTQKKDVVLVDETGSVRLTLWGTKANIDIVEGDVLALNNASTREYNGVNLSTFNNTEILKNLDIVEAHEIKGWFEEYGKHALIEQKVLDDRGLILDIPGSKYTNVCCMVTYIKEDNLYYEACVDCKKKVFYEGNFYRCEKCNKEFKDCDVRYIMKLQIADVSGQVYTSCFDKESERLVGMPAKDLKELDDPSQTQEIVKRAIFKDVVVRVSSKVENYNNEERDKITIHALEIVDYLKESKRLLKAIKMCG